MGVTGKIKSSPLKDGIHGTVVITTVIVYNIWVAEGGTTTHLEAMRFFADTFVVPAFACPVTCPVWYHAPSVHAS